MESRRLVRGVILMLVALDLGCAPKNGALPVVYIVVDDFYRVRQDAWNNGEVKKCELTSDTTQPPDARGKLFLCGQPTLNTWSITWLRPDIKTGIYENSHTFYVTFRSPGHLSRYEHWWMCQKTSDGIQCD